MTLTQIQGKMLLLFLIVFCVQESYQVECFQCNTVSLGQFSGVKTNQTDKCGGYEDLGNRVTCEDPRAFCYQEYYYRDMYYDGRPQTDVMKWDMSNMVQPDTPQTIHRGYEDGIPAGSVWRGCRVPYDNVNYDKAANSFCQTFRGEWETNFNRYWMGSECYCNKDSCNSGQKVGLGLGTLALLTFTVFGVNN